MKIDFRHIVFGLLFCCGAAAAQTLPRSVESPVLKNLADKETSIPYWGKRNLMIFYIDPDRAAQSQPFTDSLEARKITRDRDLVGIGIVNLKDAPHIPRPLLNAMIRKRNNKNATILIDDDRTLQKMWGLEGCNNMFSTIIINKRGELLFFRTGEFSDKDRNEFLRVIDDLDAELHKEEISPATK